MLPVQFSIDVGTKCCEVVFDSELEVAFLVHRHFFGRSVAVEVELFVFVVVKDLDLLDLGADFSDPVVELSVEGAFAELVDHGGVLLGDSPQKHRILPRKLLMKVIVTHVHELLPAVEVCLKCLFAYFGSVLSGVEPDVGE